MYNMSQVLVLQVLCNVWTPHWDEFVRRVFDAWTNIQPGNPPKPHWYSTWSPTIVLITF
jgi:hypothetical protein